jgi:hypothetical protein
MSIVEGVDIGDSYAVIENGKVINVIRCKSDWVPPSGQTKVNIDSLPEVGLNDSYDGSNFTTDPARIGTSDSAAWLRLERNARLTQSDWTQSRDITLSNDSEWLTYRQSLRDLPANTADPDNPTWPTKPS